MGEQTANLSEAANVGGLKSARLLNKLAISRDLVKNDSQKFRPVFKNSTCIQKSAFFSACVTNRQPRGNLTILADQNDQQTPEH